MPIVDARDLHKRFGERALLAGVRLTIRRRERVGLVGRNGSGKSTLGRILAGVERPDEGEVSLRRGARVGHLAQEPRFESGRTLRAVVADGLAEWRTQRRAHEALVRAIEAPGADLEALAERQAVVVQQLEALGGWEREHEADALLDRLGLGDPERRVDTLSGGERRRVALARLLLEAPDLAVLDEPTNHLDLEAIEWLEQELASRFPGAVLLITHDRALLDRVTSRTLELERGELHSYEGGYARYLEARAERLALADRRERNRQNFLRRELEWVRRQPKARGGKQKARMDRALEARDAGPPPGETTATLRAGATRQGKQVLALHRARLERNGHTLLRDFELTLAPGQRIGVVGPNGCGKTSLLLALRGDLALASGERHVGANTRIAYLDQARSALRDDDTVLESVAGERSQVEIAGESLSVAAYLERLLFERAAQRIRVGELSGGERARVALARLLAEPANLLLLDEPTNDLDVETLGALEAMLCDYPGSIVLVSHDRWFLDRVATSILAFEGGGQARLSAGGYSAWRERRRAEAKEAEAPAGPAPAAPRATPARPAPRKLTYAERLELEGLLDAVETAEARVARLEASLADPALYRGPHERVAELQAAVAEARAEVAARSARWEELEAIASGSD